MRSRSVITLTLGVALALGAVAMVKNQMLGTGEADAVPSPWGPTANAVVATTPLAYGSRIGQEHLKETVWPAASLPEGAFSSIAEIVGDGSEPRVAMRTVAVGELLTKTNVSGFGGRATLSAALPEGKRAFSIRVDDVSGVAGFLLPGDKVDVLLTQENPDRSKMTDVILQNVTVRGIDQIADNTREQPTVARTATVEVSTEEAQKLALAMQVGKLTLALRNALATDTAKTDTVRVTDLAGGKRASRPTVTVRRGSDVSSIVGVR